MFHPDYIKAKIVKPSTYVFKILLNFISQYLFNKIHQLTILIDTYVGSSYYELT